MLKPSDLLHIATIGRTVGFSGELKLHFHTDFLEQFKKGTSFFINPKDSLVIDSINTQKSLVSFVGFDTLEEAKKLTNKELFTTIERTRDECKLEDGEHFWFDLIGCKVVEDGQVLGEVSEVERIAGTNYLYVKTATKTFLLPKLDRFIKSVDIKDKIIVAIGAKDILEAS
ncbi:MAG: ribosome maturation factor RimM [Sulfurimonadaceae bacterium]|jgi:16S rRNA processing protein RimM|nr:ribosome maturation factor RimM [Sulfurimonadaceae bacterium]